MSKLTKDCIDPWTYVEVRVNGDVSPCCARGPIGSLTTQTLPEILNGAKARQLRSDLLTGNLDKKCANCRARGQTSTDDLEAKVRALRSDVKLPESFDSAAYLKANPDVARVGADPAKHFLTHGFLEGRALAPKR